MAMIAILLAMPKDKIMTINKTKLFTVLAGLVVGSVRCMDRGDQRPPSPTTSLRNLTEAIAEFTAQLGDSEQGRIMRDGIEAAIAEVRAQRAVEEVVEEVDDPEVRAAMEALEESRREIRAAPSPESRLGAERDLIETLTAGQSPEEVATTMANLEATGWVTSTAARSLSPDSRLAALGALRGIRPRVTTRAAMEAAMEATVRAATGSARSSESMPTTSAGRAQGPLVRPVIRITGLSSGTFELTLPDVDLTRLTRDPDMSDARRMMELGVAPEMFLSIMSEHSESDAAAIFRAIAAYHRQLTGLGSGAGEMTVVSDSETGRGWTPLN